MVESGEQATQNLTERELFFDFDKALSRISILREVLVPGRWLAHVCAYFLMTGISDCVVSGLSSSRDPNGERARSCI